MGNAGGCTLQKCELCSKFDAVYNVQVRLIPKTGITMEVNVCEKCLPFEKAGFQVVEEVVRRQVRLTGR